MSSNRYYNDDDDDDDDNEDGAMIQDDEEDDAQLELDWEHARGPKNLNGLRACIPCMLVKSYEQFASDGCENCNSDDVEDYAEFIRECTTGSFEGLAAVTQPSQSWVARWQFINNFVPGIYALKVNGQVSQEALRKLRPGLQNVGQILQQEDKKIQELMQTRN